MTFGHGADYNYEQWLDRPEVLDQDFDAMEAAGCNVMAVGIFSWSKYEPREGEFHFEWMDGLLDRLHSRGMKAILATPTAAKPAWLSAAYPSSRMVDAQGRRAPHGGRHNHCRTSADYRRLAVALNTKLAERYANHPAVALWHVNNEYGSGRCHCPECLSAFRTWLQKRYGTLEALNKAWWTDFWSHRFETWQQIEPVDPSIQGLMLDWARFTSDQTLDFFLAESEPLRRVTPHIPITTNFHGPDVGLDYFSFAQHLDVASFDSYPRWHADGDDAAVAARAAFHFDLIRGTKGKPFLLMESSPSQTNWQGVSPLKRPGLHVLASVQAVAHGADSVQYFQWRQSRGGEETFHGSVLTNPGSTETRTFREVAEVGRVLKELEPLAGTPVPAEVAVVLDLVNHWALDLSQLPRNLAKGYWDEVLAHHTALTRRGYAVDVVDSSADFSAYKVVVAPMLFLLRPGVAEALTAFVTAGGTLITGYLTGSVDDSTLAYFYGRPGPLAKLLGVKVEETDAIPEARPQTLEYGPVDHRVSYPVRHYADLLAVDAEVHAVFGQDFYTGRPAVTRKVTEKGEAWYVAARADSSFLEEFLAERCRHAGAEPQVAWELPPGVQVRRRGNPGEEALFVMNFNDTEVEVPAAGAPLGLGPYGWRLLTPS